MGIAGIFSMICPCWFPRKKDMSEVVAMEHSANSASSLEASTAAEKLPGSPVRVPPSPSRFSMAPITSAIGSVHLNMSQVIKATQNFSPSLLIGEGGFGTVYRAQLQDGQVVAIKRAKKAFKSFNAGKLVEMLDPSMTEAVHVGILSKMFSLAFQCAAPTRGHRPNMKEVGEQLWGIRMNYLKSVKRGG